MSCRPFQLLLSRALDQRLDRASRVALDAHLEACRACAEDASLLSRVGAALALDGPASPPADLTAGIDRAVRAATHTGSQSSADEARTSWAWWLDRWLPVAWPAAAITAVAAAVLLTLALQRDRGPTSVAPASPDPVTAATVAPPMPDLGAALLAVDRPFALPHSGGPSR